MSDRPILVLGATGNVGLPLARQLTEAGRRVRAFFDPSTAQRDQLPSGVDVVHASFDDHAALRAASSHVEAVFVLTPPNPAQVRWQRAMIDAAVAGGAERIVKLSAFDSGPYSPLQMGRWHHDGEVALRETEVGWTILRPQYFLQNLRVAFERAVTTGVLAGAAAPDLRLGFVDAEDVAAVAAVALTGNDHVGHVLVPTGPEALSFAGLAKRLGRYIGKDIRYVQRPREEISVELAQRGFPEWHIADYFAIHGDAAGDCVTTTVFDLTGRPAHRLEDVLERYGMNLPPSTVSV